MAAAVQHAMASPAAAAAPEPAPIEAPVARGPVAAPGPIPPVTPEPGPEAPAKPPTTLGEIVKAKSLTPELLLGDKWRLSSVVRELFAAKGTNNPTPAQEADLLHKVHTALQGGGWESLTAPDAGMIQLADGVDQRLGNIFGEKEVFSDDELQADRLRLGDHERRNLEGGYESGVTGMVLGASFINTRHRAEGDFSRAYGDEAWNGFTRAHVFLESIPRGQLLAQLSVDLICEVNRLVHAPDTGLKAKALRFVAMVGRGGKWDHGGELREGRQFARHDRYSQAELANLREAGVNTVGASPGDEGDANVMLEYPKPEEVRPTLERLIAELRAEWTAEGADPIAAASKFQRHFVALHPFGDSNGRTSRLIMNRILAEADLPPAILEDQNRDISRSPEEWRDEVARGVARSKRFLGNPRVESKDQYIGKLGLRGPGESPNKPVLIAGRPFDLGGDGLLYDPTGRPWMASGDVLMPMAQLEHYMLVRRLGQMGAEPGSAKLAQITADTRALYERARADADLAAKIEVQDDATARAADADYALSPTAAVAATLTDAASPDKLDPEKLFKIGGGTGRGTEASAVLSKYAQVDLEYWYLEDGLARSGADEAVVKVRTARNALFAMAKEAVGKTRDEARVSPENPHGFRYRYEQLMYETSPLSCATLDEARTKFGDDSITVWRGDYSFSRLIGMAPNNDVRQPDAKAVAEDREDKGQIGNLYDDLVKLEGSAMGRQYICTTSDLALLTGSFASTVKSQPVNLGGVPAIFRERLLSWLDPKREGATPEAKAELRKKEEERGDSVLSGPDGGTEIKDALGIPGTILRVKVLDAQSAKIEVTAHRKAFGIKLPKRALLPGIYALGGPSFESEQEMHGLERVYPWQIKSAHTVDQLKEEFPVVGQVPADGAVAPDPTPAPLGPTPEG